MLTKVWRQSDQVSCALSDWWPVCSFLDHWAQHHRALHVLACGHRVHVVLHRMRPPRSQLLQTFVGILNAVRFGDNSAAQRLFQLCRRPLAERDGIKPTQVGCCSSSC